jgi:hypothetical protein
VTFDIRRPPKSVPPPRDYGRVRDSELGPWLLSLLLLVPLLMVVLPFLPKF